MKTCILVLCLMAMSYAQQPPRPTESRPLTRPSATGFPTRPRPDGDPRNNVQSQCGFGDRMCRMGERCIESRVPATYTCVNPVAENGTCMLRMLFDDVSDSDRMRVLNDQDFSEERLQRERGEGVRDRDTARTINGADERPQCIGETQCIDNVCRRPDQTRCQMQRQSDAQVRCSNEGMFEPLQCRASSEDTTPQICRCVNPQNGSMIPNTMRRVADRDDVPQCNTRSFRDCPVRREGRNVSVRHGDAIPRARGGRCQQCRCNNGMLQCQNISENCPRSDPDRTPASCMMNGEEVQHGERRQDGKCNMCACRNGQMVCTTVKECRDEDAESDDDGDAEQRKQCDDCMNMPSGPVCAMREGRTFPTRCHAMRCQNIERSELRDGACSEGNACQDTPCRLSSSTCMLLGGQTRMSRERDSPDNRRACVDRMQLHCRPTEERPDGSRRIRDDDNTDNIIERLERAREMLQSDEDDNEDDNEDDRTVCANDGFEYPSTCHMMLEYQRNDMPPRVMHTGRCQDMPQNDEERRMRMVCATDGMTYTDEDTMRTVGGNVRLNFNGRCDAFDEEGEQPTPAQRCMRVQQNNACPKLPDDCERRVMPSDSCCPRCGSAVTLAMDQELVDEHVRNGNELGVDDLLGGMLRRNGDRDPIINSSASRMCNISAIRPTQERGSNVEILFEAKEGRDANMCHQHAMNVMRRVNMEQQASVTTEENFIAAAVVAPEAVVEEQGDGATTFAASCMVLLGAVLGALFV